MNIYNLIFSGFLRIFTISLIVVFFCKSGLADDHLLNTLKGRQSQIISKTMRVMEEGFKKERSVIFEGDVRYHYRNKTVTFYGDKMILRVKTESRLKFFQILGNVKMEKGDVFVSSDEAHSANFNKYVDFYGNVEFSIGSSSMKVEKIRYSFATGTFFLPEYGVQATSKGNDANS